MTNLNSLIIPLGVATGMKILKQKQSAHVIKYFRGNFVGEMKYNHIGPLLCTYCLKF